MDHYIAELMQEPIINPNELREANYVLFRHGLSQFNYKIDGIREEYGSESPEYFETLAKKEMIDPELHEYGLSQCQVQQELVNSIKWSVVLVSPI